MNKQLETTDMILQPFFSEKDSLFFVLSGYVVLTWCKRMGYNINNYCRFLEECFMADIRENRPTADVLMFSMRAMGYTFEAAIADVIDNSISADASIVELGFPTTPTDCFVTISDNGTGMTADELFDAMKYGSQLKGQNRSESDLGRFGLGLKSASLSQCRKLTVISKKNGTKSAMIWDLDVVEKEKDWAIVVCSPEETENLRNSSWLDDKNSGTIVVWENFDILEKDIGQASLFHELLTLEDSTAEYLSLIFHRFLNRRAGEKAARITMKVGEHTLSGLDPFLENHKKTNPRRMIEIAVPDSKGEEQYVIAQPYILPFQKDMSKEDMRRIGGVENYRTKQGFYIYRNERLIIWGTWFGRPKGELTKHARIKVDIPNTLDDLWSIDIKKQRAKIPSIIKQRLTRAVDEAMDLAIRAQKYRGRVEKVNQDVDYIWDRISMREGVYSYRINRNSRVFDLLKGHMSDEAWQRLALVLDEIENSIPYQQIYIDKSQNSLDDTIDSSREDDVAAEAALLLPTVMSFTGADRVSAIEMLFASEPYCNYPAIKQKMIAEGDN